MPTFSVVATEWEYCELAEHRVRYRGEEQVIGTLSLPDAVLRVPPRELILVAGRLAADGRSTSTVRHHPTGRLGGSGSDTPSTAIRSRPGGAAADAAASRDRLVPGRLTRLLGPGMG